MNAKTTKTPTYTLDGREWDGESEAPCLFCAEPLEHVNNGGDGWCVSAVVNGEARSYLYCYESPCKAATKALLPGGAIWRCGCGADYVENVGDTCASCGVTRANAVPGPGVVCPHMHEWDERVYRREGNTSYARLEIDCPQCGPHLEPSAEHGSAS